jgi:hypothetical protein
MCRWIGGHGAMAPLPIYGCCHVRGTWAIVIASEAKQSIFDT